MLQAISGAIGDLVFYRDAYGNFIVQRKGEREAPSSEEQFAQNGRFKRASAFGNLVKSDPALVAEYRRFCQGGMQPYHAGLWDYLRAPAVTSIDLQLFTGQPGQLVRVVATDDSRVLSVELLIRHAATNAILEQGPAELRVIADQRLYTTRSAIASGTPILVEATAADRAGNVGVARVQFLVP